MSMIGFAGAGRWVGENELSKSMLSELGTRSRINTCRRSLCSAISGLSAIRKIGVPYKSSTDANRQVTHRSRVILKSPSAVSGAPRDGSAQLHALRAGRFGYSDLKEAAPMEGYEL